MTWWLITEDGDKCQQGTEEWQYDKCDVCSRDSVEELWDCSSIKSELFRLEVEVKNVKYILLWTYFETDLCVVYKTIIFYLFSFNRKEVFGMRMYCGQVFTNAVFCIASSRHFSP